MMRTRWLHQVGLLLALVPPACAQTVVGVWQGTLPIAENSRVVVTITRAGDGALRGGYTYIDRSGSGMQLTSVVFTAPELTLSQVYAEVGYKGKLSADGKSLVGTWIQQKDSYPLTLALATPETLWHPGTAVPPMAANADPSFEVATIKPSAPDAKGRSYGMRTRQFTAKNHTVLELIRFAYHLQERQIEGLPAWCTDLRFDIAAEPDAPGQPNQQQYQTMMRKLLADRFHMVVHTVEREMPVYKVMVGTGPLKIKRSDPSFSRHGLAYIKDAGEGKTAMYFDGFNMPLFADALMNFVDDRQVVDGTGLTGEYDMEFIVSTGPEGSDEDWSSALLGAIQSAGLKLAPTRAEVAVTVVDRVEKPSAN